ncbi:MAG TPA: Asp-tRNA(Asn)/Glu-tRNA(Gln) amidotransferase subunit GatC, partial [Acidimicrobiales bacterium]|nr:Asp-tRNA(Asn)/Glu-tRNA(Gln) amidotransferase subunit GatC [Acidimicrobiales bacterium]
MPVTVPLYDGRVAQPIAQADRDPKTGLISKAEVAHVARLARLALTSDELERYTVQLGAVLSHAADIASLE